MKRVALLYGGRSGEHEVSLRSAAAVYRNLDPEKYSVTCIGIDKKGVWYRVNPDEASEKKKNISRLQVFCREDDLVSCIPGRGLYCRDGYIPLDIVFPVLHGTFGEDGTLQGLLEMIGLPYVGAGVLGSALGMDKDKAKRLWQKGGVPVVPSFCVHRKDISEPGDTGASLVNAVQNSFGFPVFVKPVCAGSSVGVSKVHTPAGLFDAVMFALTFDTRILIEKAVKAREIECSVIGNESPEAFIPGEIRPSHEFYDYASKYIDEQGAGLFIPAEIEPKKIQEIKKLAVRAFTLCGIHGYARVDLFFDEVNNSLYINEINTIPGFTEISMFPKMCEASGLDFGPLLDALIGFGIEKGEERNALSYEYDAFVTSD